MNLVDTNVLLDYPKIVEDLEDIVLHMSVLEELDLLKNKNQEVGKKARRASKTIFQNKEKIVFNNEPVYFECTDDVLIMVAKKYDYTVITNDINLLIKCNFENVKYKTYLPDEDNVYTGITKLYIGIDDEDIADIYEGYIPIDLKENEYVFIMDENKKCKAQFKYKRGELIPVRHLTIPASLYSQEIKPRNPEQKALINSLFDEENTIIYAGGSYGVGKTKLLTSYALYQLMEGKINKIVFVPNNSIVENSRDLGTLPGDTFNKELSYLGPLVDIIGDSIEVKRLYDENHIEIMPISLARGRNLENCIVIVSEAQNLTQDHIKLLLARCAEGTRIFFDGDIKQSDKQIFREKNGLKLLNHLKDSENFAHLFSVVKLESIERSATAQAAQYLDEVE